MFDIKIPPAPHPYYNTTAEQVFKVIKNSGISGHQVGITVYSKTRLSRPLKKTTKKVVFQNN